MTSNHDQSWLMSMALLCENLGTIGSEMTEETFFIDPIDYKEFGDFLAIASQFGDVNSDLH
jgi:hypothetical protein